jgi:putative transposase
MIDRGHGLPLVRQAALLKLSRSSLYYEPRPVPAGELAIMRRIDALHLDHPFAGSRMLRDLLRGEGVVIGRERVATMMRRMGIAALGRRPSTSKPAPGHKIHPYLLRGLAVERPNQVWAMDITYIPMARGFVYLAAVVDWFSRRVLAWRLSITLEVEFCLDAVEEALARHGRPEIFNTDQGSQFTSAAFTGLLLENAIAISMDGRGAWRDNVSVERLWRSVKYEEVYLRAYDSVGQARASLGRYLDFYCLASQHPSGYVVDDGRASWPGGDPAGWFGFLLAWLTMSRAAGPASAARLKIQGPSGSGCMASIRPASTARRSVFGLTRRRAAALLRFSQGAWSAGAVRWTGMPRCDRSAVTRSRVQRLPRPVRSPFRFSMPAMTSSPAIRTN